MKLRPQFNLKLRDAEQFIQFQNIAAAQGISMTEWLLRQAEASVDLKRGLPDIAGLNRTATGIDQMREQAGANMQRGRKNANHTESADERVERVDSGARKSGRGKSMREVGKAGGEESGVQGTENSERVVAPEKDAVGAEVVTAKKIRNTSVADKVEQLRRPENQSTENGYGVLADYYARPHGSPFAPREIPTASGLSGTPENLEPFHPAPWVCESYMYTPKDDEDKKE